MQAHSKVVLVGLTILALVSLWAGGPASTALAQDSPTLVARAVFDVNIRALPTVNSAILAVLAAGDEAVAIGRTPANNWIQVEYGSTTGWVAAWLTVYSGDTAILPIASDQAPTGNAGGPFTLVSPYNVNIRAEPDPHSDLVTMLPFNASGEAIARNEASSWVRVRYQGVEGWAAAWLVVVQGDISELPVDGAANATPLNAPQTPTPAAEDELPAEDDTAVEDDAAGEAPGLLPPAPPADSDYTITTPFRVNIRSAPSVNANVLGIIPTGSVVAAFGQNAAYNWIQVEYGGIQGWVAAWVVIGSADLSGLPVTSQSAEFSPLEADTLVARSVYDVAIRTGPGLTYGLQAEVPAYTDMLLLGRTDDSSWVRVNYEGTEGWVAAWLITASGDLTNLPVESRAAP
jgi:uncharacterized protein YraI